MRSILKFCIACVMITVLTPAVVVVAEYSDTGVITREELVRSFSAIGLYLNEIDYPDAAVSNQETFILLARLLGASSYDPLPLPTGDALESYALRYLDWFVENDIISNAYYELAQYKTASDLEHLTMRILALMESTPDIETVSGRGNHGFSDGDIANARFTRPQGIFVSNEDGLIILDTNNNAIRTLIDGEAVTLADSTIYIYDEPLTRASLNTPTSGVSGIGGGFFFADSGNHVIRQVINGRATTFGSAIAGHRDGLYSVARFNMPMAIATDDIGNIYVADTLNNVIRKIDTDGMVTTIAGVAGSDGYANGSAGLALFREPGGIAVSADGSVIYVADTGNHVIRKIENGYVVTVAGIALAELDESGLPLGGFANGPVDASRFTLPRGIILVDDILIVADSGNNRIRAITSSGIVTTVAGSGEAGDRDGFSLGPSLHGPADISYNEGFLYIADAGNNKIKRMAFDVSRFE